MRSDSAFVHTDAVQPNILNFGGPGKTLDVSEVIKVLNSQITAALKTVSTVIGRGESGVNTASVEARIFALNADELNQPVAELLSNALTLALRLHGSDSYVQVRFKPVEMRPALELEPQLSVRQARLTEALSYGIVTDDEYHLMVFNRIRPDDVEELSGTRFFSGTEQPDISPNSDPLGRSLAPEGGKGSRSNGNKPGRKAGGN